MSAVCDCPGIECWQALLGDTIEATERDRYERHLESCSACQERLHRLESDENGLRSLGRRIGDPTAAPLDPTLVQVLVRLHEVKAPIQIAPQEPAELYFLRPTEKPSVLGVLGDYEVLDVIGQGGMGVVLKAFEPKLHRLVAIKVLAAALAGSATARRRFTREAQSAAAVCHDNIIAVHGVDEIDGLPYLVMQYIAGESLQERLDRTGPLETKEIVRIGLQTASGLAAAHAQGLIHRDIKPANLLLENCLPRVKITDFGLARMADDVGLTQNGIITGTPEYMAPEQARGEAVDHRADLFSLGSVLYACCTGAPPFRGSTALAVLSQVSEKEPAPIRSLNPDVPAWLETFIARLMAKDPAERFQSAAEVAALLEGYLAHLCQPDTVPVSEIPPLPRKAAERSPHLSWSRFAYRSSLRVWFLALAASFVLGLGISIWFQPGVKLLNQVHLDQQKPALQPDFHQDLRGADLENSLLRPIDGRVRSEPAGMRVTLSAGDEVRGSSGLVTNATIHGDFEITGSFEILKVDRPKTGYGAGVGLYAAVDAGANDSVSLAHRLMPDGTTWFVSDRMTPTKNGLNHLANRVEATATEGRLRLQRVGSRLRFFIADGSQSDFVLVDDVEFSAEDIELIKFEANTGGSKSDLDCRLLDFTLRVDNVTDPSRWWIALIICVGILLCCGAVRWWQFARQRRRAAKVRINAVGADLGKVPSSPSTAPALSLPCSACGKRLKVKAELAGRKVKCPQCGQAVVVPSIKAPDSRGAS